MDDQIDAIAHGVGFRLWVLTVLDEARTGVLSPAGVRTAFETIDETYGTDLVSEWFIDGDGTITPR